MAACPNNVCGGFTNSGEYFQFVAGAGGASGYILFSDLMQGINEWNGAFYSNAQFQTQIIESDIDYQKQALAKAIADENGEDVDTIYNNLSWQQTVGGNADFLPSPNINLSFLSDSNQYRAGSFPSVHIHTMDGLVHLDYANPYTFLPFGLLSHFFIDVLFGHINSSVPMGPF